MIHYRGRGRDSGCADTYLAPLSTRRVERRWQSRTEMADRVARPPAWVFSRAESPEYATIAVQLECDLLQFAVFLSVESLGSHSSRLFSPSPLF